MTICGRNPVVDCVGDTVLEAVRVMLWVGDRACDGEPDPLTDCVGVGDWDAVSDGVPLTDWDGLVVGVGVGVWVRDCDRVWLGVWDCVKLGVGAPLGVTVVEPDCDGEREWLPDCDAVILGVTLRVTGCVPVGSCDGLCEAEREGVVLKLGEATWLRVTEGVRESVIDGVCDRLSDTLGVGEHTSLRPNMRTPR
jgi:hypothetical protein